ncbi:MAG: DUF1801 domain-containing protein [Chryseolinea sp.]
MPRKNQVAFELGMATMKEKSDLLLSENITDTKLAKATKNDAAKVSGYMEQLNHPLKKEIDEVRKIIKSSNPLVMERIKWNAPSYYYMDDMVTFHLRVHEHVHLIFHHPFVIKIDSPLLIKHYDNRRMVYFKSMKEINTAAVELKRIVNLLVSFQNKLSK